MPRKNDDKLVGAAEKRAKAKKFAGGYEIQSKREGPKPNQLLPVAVVYGLAIIFAFVLTDDVLSTGLGIGIGNASFDQLFFGPGQLALTGGKDVDYALNIFARGTLIFLLAGVVPGLSWLWQRLLDTARMNVYIVVWGVSIAIGLIYHVAKDTVAPLLKTVAGIIF